MAARIDPRLLNDAANAGKVEVTCVIQIGNSDDKLTQKEWVGFLRDVHFMVRQVVKAGNGALHFFGTAPPDSEYQNACWVFVLTNPEALASAQAALVNIAANNQQDSIALTVGSTDLVYSPAGKARQEEGQPRKEIRT